jgi:hypothetical protein
MNCTTNYNLTKEDAIGMIRRTDANNHPTGGIRINVVYTMCNGQWRFLIGRCTPNHPAQGDAHQTYQDHVFISKKIEQTEYTAIMEALHGEGVKTTLNLPLLKIVPTATWMHNVIPSSHSLAETPFQRFWIVCEREPMPWSNKLIKHGLPFHKSPAKYIKEFLKLDEFHGSQDSRKGSLILDIPETRGRIVLADNKLSINSQMPDLCIVGQTAAKPSVILHGSETYPITSQELRDAEFWLISKDDQIIDFISSSEMPPRNTQPAEVDYEALIMRGECENCELKPYISISNAKAEELLRATCALSNTQGGYIFIGVSDDTEICGIPDNEIQRDYKTDPSNAMERYERDIKSKLREGLRDNQCFTTKIIQIAESKVMVISVTQSDSLNYLRTKREAYTRRGASSAKMTPHEILAHKKPNYLEGLFGKH